VPECDAASQDATLVLTLFVPTSMDVNSGSKEIEEIKN
jgi:hypothetical protein